MYVRRERVAITTDGAGAGTGFTPVLSGRLIDIQYVADGSVPYDNTVDMTITGDITGRTLLSKSNVAASFINAPRQATHGTDGVASLYAAGGLAVQDHICLDNERVSIVLSQGGAVKTGVFYVTVA